MAPLKASTKGKARKGAASAHRKTGGSHSAKSRCGRGRGWEQAHASCCQLGCVRNPCQLVHDVLTCPLAPAFRCRSPKASAPLLKAKRAAELPASPAHGGLLGGGMSILDLHQHSGLLSADTSDSEDCASHGNHGFSRWGVGARLAWWRRASTWRTAVGPQTAVMCTVLSALCSCRAPAVAPRPHPLHVHPLGPPFVSPLQRMRFASLAPGPPGAHLCWRHVLRRTAAAGARSRGLCAHDQLRHARRAAVPAGRRPALGRWLCGAGGAAVGGLPWHGQRGAGTR